MKSDDYFVKTVPATEKYNICGSFCRVFRYKLHMLSYSEEEPLKVGNFVIPLHIGIE